MPPIGPHLGNFQAPNLGIFRVPITHFSRPSPSSAPSSVQPCVEPHVLLFPLLEPSPAGRGGRILVGQETPRSARLQHPQDAFEAGPIRCPRTAPSVLAPLRLRQQRLNQLPLPLTQQLKTLLAHAKSSTNHPPHAEVHSLRPNLFMKHALKNLQVKWPLDSERPFCLVAVGFLLSGFLGRFDGKVMAAFWG